MFRRTFHLAALFVILLAFPHIAYGETVKISYGGTSGYNVPLWVTQEAGLFKKYGLDSELILISGASASMQAMLANQTQFANTSGSAPVHASLQGTKVVIIASTYNFIPYSFVVHEDIKSPQDLKGKLMAISRLGGITEFAAYQSFEKFGIGRKGMTLIQAGPDAQRIPAVAAKRAAATVLAPPGLFKATSEGLRVLADLGDLGIKYPTSVMFVTNDYLRSNRASVKKFLMSLVEGLHLYGAPSRRDFVVRVMQKYTKLNDQEILSKSHDYFLKKTSLVPLADPEAVQNTLPADKAKDHKPEEFFDDSLIRELASEGFIEKIAKLYK